MPGAALQIAPLVLHTPTARLCAAWRHDAFLADYGYSLEDSYAQLCAVMSPHNDEVALVAELDGEPVGICMYVDDELEPAHELSPWLASLYVVPGWRRRGIARELVAATEAHARDLGVARLHLYTDSAEALYLRCGWQVSERFDWDGEPFTLMHRDLGSDIAGA